MVEVLISYAAGTADMMRVCLDALRRHDAGEPFNAVVLAGDETAFEEAHPLLEGDECLRLYSCGGATNSGRHARMLDAAIADSRDEYVLTLDSDCFPVADGWLARLMGSGCDVSGILWPWAPPDATVGRNTMEWRIRRQHCYNNTQVACQLLKVEMVRDMWLKFADPSGDDTNFGLMDKVHAAGLKVGGLMPTRCALPDDKSFNPELNRHVCVVYGDLVYHHGGASRERHGAFVADDNLFGGPRKRVMSDGGAEWVLDSASSHAYRMDMEGEVVKFKMDLMMNMAVALLRQQDSLFGGGWV